MNLISLISEPFTYPFMQRALIAAVAVGVVCALFSCFLVLKGWSLMGDAISHAVLPGIVLAYVIGLPLIIGAFSSGLLCAVTTGYIKDHCRVKEDTVMGIVYSGLFSAGIVMYSFIDTEQHLSHILFGNVLGITQFEFYQMLFIALTVSSILLIKRKDMMLFCFDVVQAKVVGLPIKCLHYGMLCLLSLTIVAALQAVGVILVIAMLVAPGIIAFTLCKRFSAMLLVATAVSIISCMSGTLISYYIDGATGASIILVQAMLFIIAQVYKMVMITKLRP